MPAVLACNKGCARYLKSTFRLGDPLLLEVAHSLHPLFLVILEALNCHQLPLGVHAYGASAKVTAGWSCQRLAKDFITMQV